MTLPKETPMIERLAVIICEQRGHDPYSTCDIIVPGDPEAIFAWAGFRNDARAVLKALEEPTPGMVAEAVDNVGPIGCCSHSPETARETWQAMITAALTEGEGHD